MATTVTLKRQRNGSYVGGIFCAHRGNGGWSLSGKVGGQLRWIGNYRTIAQCESAATRLARQSVKQRAQTPISVVAPPVMAKPANPTIDIYRGSLLGACWRVFVARQLSAIARTLATYQ